MNKKSLFLSELSLMFINFGPDFSKTRVILPKLAQIFRVSSGSLEDGLNISLFSLPNRILFTDWHFSLFLKTASLYSFSIAHRLVIGLFLDKTTILTFPEGQANAFKSQDSMDAI